MSSDGVFGDISGGSIVVEFTYELELIPFVALDEILRSFEVDLVDSLLSQLFDACGDAADLVTSIDGISARPDDEASTDIACEPKLDANNTCIVVDGYISIYTDDPLDAELVEDALQEGMENGDFTDETIVRVGFVDDGTGGTPPVIDDDTVTPKAETGNNLLVALTVTGAGALVIAIAAVAYRRRNTPGKDPVESLLSSTILSEAPPGISSSGEDQETNAIPEESTEDGSAHIDTPVPSGEEDFFVRPPESLLDAM